MAAFRVRMPLRMVRTVDGLRDRLRGRATRVLGGRHGTRASRFRRGRKDGGGRFRANHEVSSNPTYHPDLFRGFFWALPFPGKWWMHLSHRISSGYAAHIRSGCDGKQS